LWHFVQLFTLLINLEQESCQNGVFRAPLHFEHIRGGYRWRLTAGESAGFPPEA
jgi:hypothetical protein